MTALDLGWARAAVKVRVDLLLGGAGVMAPAKLRRPHACKTAPLTRCEKLTTGA